MTTHYLVQDSNGKYRIRQGIFGCFPFFFQFLYQRPNSWKFNYSDISCSALSTYDTEEEALAVWEKYKRKSKPTFKILHKLT